MMKRRHFLNASVGAAACLTTTSCKTIFDTNKATDSQHDSGAAKTDKLGQHTLHELREQYRSDLFDDFLPFMDRYVIDHQYGGFMCNTDRRGNNITQTKSSWYEGRGIWVYSFLYNNLAQDEKYMDVARNSVDFILKTKPVNPYGIWPRSLSREGVPKSPPSPQIYGNLFIAEGLAEYAKAAQKEEYWNLAKDIILRCVHIYDQPDYYPEIGKTYLGPSARPFPGARIQGVWMVLIRIATQMLRANDDPDLKQIADRCVDAVMNYHYNPEFDLINECINHDLSRPDNEYAQLVYTGHALETLWMIMDEAVRRQDRALFELAAKRFRRHFEVAWDDVYGGVFRNLQHVDNNIWSLDKVLWAQEEVLIGSLTIVEYLGLDWGRDIFSTMYNYVIKNYPLKKYGYSLWNNGTDRQATFKEKATRVGNFHHPRHLMLNLLSLDRMIARNGRISDHFI